MTALANTYSADIRFVSGNRIANKRGMKRRINAHFGIHSLSHAPLVALSIRKPLLHGNSIAARREVNVR